jgi:hypothetical protein
MTAMPEYTDVQRSILGCKDLEAMTEGSILMAVEPASHSSSEMSAVTAFVTSSIAEILLSQVEVSLALRVVEGVIYIG